MDCCTVHVTPDGMCPECGVRGRKVGVVTPRSLVSERDFQHDGWRFCRTVDCPVAYFHDGEAVVDVAAVSVEITQKTTAPDRPVCYCFGYSAADILADHDGLIPADIKARCRRGEDRCPETNPQGSCCLGNVFGVWRTRDEAR
ncbi:MAG: hypothetical protein ACI9VR_003375 [Cognaticolwellia sp.]|jgi:hypothetical protein